MGKISHPFLGIHAVAIEILVGINKTFQIE